MIFFIPSSVAFSITKSVLSFFKGANNSQISGQGVRGLVWDFISISVVFLFIAIKNKVLCQT